jgi:hypothetical protein
MPRNSRPPLHWAALLCAGLLAACGGPTDPFTSGPARASVAGTATDAAGQPLAQATIAIACGGSGPTVVIPADSAGHYLVNLATGPDPFVGSSGRLRCHFREPATGQARAQVDTVLGFARGPVLVVLQFVDLHEP